MQRYRERLRVGPGPWVGGLAFTVAVWVVFHHAFGPTVSVPVAAGTVLAVGGALLWWGRVLVEAGPDGLRVGPAVLPWWAVGTVRSFDGADAVRARGRDLDPSSHLVLRGYLPGIVTVQVTDPDDPAPGWVLSTRRPGALGAAVEQWRDQAAQSRQM